MQKIIKYIINDIKTIYLDVVTRLKCQHINLSYAICSSYADAILMHLKIMNTIVILKYRKILL